MNIFDADRCARQMVPSKHRRGLVWFATCGLAVVAAACSPSSPASRGAASSNGAGATTAPATGSSGSLSASIAPPTVPPVSTVPGAVDPQTPLQVTDTVVINDAQAGTVLDMQVPITDSAVVNDAVMSWAAVRRSAFASSANFALSQPAPAPAIVAPPTTVAVAPTQAPPSQPVPTTVAAPPPTTPPPTPTLLVGVEPNDARAIPGLLRLRTEEDLGPGRVVSHLAIYRLPNSGVVLGSGLIEPSRRQEVVDLVRSRVNAGPADAAGWSTGMWPGALFGSVLAGLQLGTDGSLVAVVEPHLLVAGGEPAVVALEPSEASPLLSAEARWLLGDVAPAWTTQTPDCSVERCVALTYDDGPSPDTARLLDVLAHARLRSTFFMIGLSVQKRPDVAKAVADGGHEIGNHTWSHPRLGDLGLADQQREVFATEYAISATTGITASLLRPPAGAYDDDTRNLGFGVALWNVDTRDWEHRDPAQTVERALVDSQPGSIVLMHDLHASTVDASALIIAGLRSDGFRLVAMGELVGQPVPGTLYYSLGKTEPFEPAPPPPSAPVETVPAPPAPTAPGTTVADAAPPTTVAAG